MGLWSILSVIHIISIGTMLNFNGGNNGHGLKKLRVNKPFETECQLEHLNTTNTHENMNN